MPRIAAANIEEHVRRQTDRIVAAARRLFHKHGYHGTDLADIAGEVGLARNSLYRYFPNKDELLLACIRQDMQPHMARFACLGEDYRLPLDRIIGVVNMQFDLATGPAHATLELMAEVREASGSLRKEIESLHRAPNQFVEQALEELHGKSGANATRSALIGGMVLAATAHALSGKKSAYVAIRTELVAAVRAVVTN
jgi:AcrR family transcriptional regulator